MQFSGITASDTNEARTITTREVNALNNPPWFPRFAKIVHEIVAQHGGAYATTFDGLKATVQEQDSSLMECPESVFDHPSMPLRRVGLRVSGYVEGSREILLIHFDRMSRDAAMSTCLENGLSPDVMLRLMDRFPSQYRLQTAKA